MVTLTYSKQNGYQVPNLRMDEVENEPQTWAGSEEPGRNI